MVKTWWPGREVGVWTGARMWRREGARSGWGRWEKGEAVERERRVRTVGRLRKCILRCGYGGKVFFWRWGDV